MMRCNYIRERIDEADKPDLLSFEVTEHIAECPDCERFAAERSALRMLVASSARVSAPINFDAVLNARLAEVKARRPFWWLGSPVYFRLGAATAGLVIMVLVAQFAGLFSKPDQRVSKALPPNATAQFPKKDLPSPEPRVLQLPEPQLSPDYSTVAAGPRPIRMPRRDLPVRRRNTPDGYLTAEDGGVVLVRGQNGEMDVQMPTVSVGAQPLLYVRAGQRAVSNIGTSF